MRKTRSAAPHERTLSPEQAGRLGAVPRETHRAFTEKATRAYHEQIAKLPEDQQAWCRRLERRKDPPWPLEFIQGMVEDPAEYRRLWALAQMLYARAAPYDAGIQWFDDLFAASFPAPSKKQVLRLVLSLAHDLDGGRHRKAIKRTGKMRGGIRRMWAGSWHLPSNEGAGWGWIFALHEPGSLLYLPAYKLAFQLRLGEAVRFPRCAYPGISMVPDGDDARFTLESHAPPPDHQRSRLVAVPGPGPSR